MVRFLSHWLAPIYPGSRPVNCTVDDFGNLVYASSVQMSVYYDAWRWSLS